jgi:nucleoside-diphosphate-sugar epimerase
MLGGGVARALAERGDRVTVLQRHPAELGLPEVLTDISDANAVLAAVDGHDAVIHLAAKVNVIGRRPNTNGSMSKALRRSSMPAQGRECNDWCTSHRRLSFIPGAR